MADHLCYMLTNITRLKCILTNICNKNSAKRRTSFVAVMLSCFMPNCIKQSEETETVQEQQSLSQVATAAYLCADYT